MAPAIAIEARQIVDGDAVVLRGNWLNIAGGHVHSITGAPAEDTQRLDFSRYTMLPGLIDTHVHFFDWVGIHDEAAMEAFLHGDLQLRLDAFLAHGITTVRSCGDPDIYMLGVRAAVAAGRRPGPRLLAVGAGLTSRDGHPGSTVYGRNPWYRALASREMDNPEEARFEIQRLAEMQVDAVKLLHEGGCGCDAPYIHQIPGGEPHEIKRIKTDVMRAAIDESHRLGMRVTVHTIQEELALAAVEMGVDGLEHGVHRMPITDQRLLDLAGSSGVMIAGTLVVLRDSEGPANIRLLRDAGARIVIGTDTCQIAPRWGELTIDEIEAHVTRCGFTPAEAIRAATMDAAAHMGRSADLGALKSGYVADAILVDGDPLSDITALRRVVAVIQSGRLVVDRRAESGREHITQ